MSTYSLQRSTMRSYLFNAPYDLAQYWATQGKITAYEWRAYKLAATWIAARFGGTAANDQEAYFCRCGWDALINRRTRALKLWRDFCFAPVRTRVRPETSQETRARCSQQSTPTWETDR